MAVSRWQLIKSETPEFHDRYLLKLDSSREDTLKLYKKFEKFSCVPFATNDDDFGWGVYMDGIDEKGLEVLKSYLADVTHPGLKKPKMEQLHAPMEKIEIIDSTWDWQKMQMEKGNKFDEESSTNDKPKSSRIIDFSASSEKEPPKTHREPLPEAPIKEEPMPTDIKKEEKEEQADEPQKEELIRIDNITPDNSAVSDEPVDAGAVQDTGTDQKEEPVKSTVEVDEIVNELNKILAEYTQDKEPEAEVNGVTKEPVPQADEPASGDDAGAIEELSKMIDSPGPAAASQGDEAKLAQPAAPEPDTVTVNQETETTAVTPSVDLHAAEAAGPPSVPSTIRIIILTSSDDEALGERFSKNIAETINKISKGKLSLDVLNKIAINNDAFDPQALFKQIEENYPEIICFVGLENASEFKVSQFISMIDKKKISHNKMQKNQIDKKFVYLDLAVAMMLVKRKILGRTSSF